jgi:carboxyl-terminal processing protease
MKLILRYLYAFLLVGSIFIGGLYAGNTLVDSAIAKSSDPYSSLHTIAQALHIVENNYIEEIETELLVRSAVSGIANDLDEHSHYFPPNEYNKLKKSADGWSVGIGVEINNENIITNLAPKGPASIAGLIVGDQIIEINEMDTLNWSPSKIKKEFKGKKGTSLKIRVKRKTEQIDYTVIRDDVRQVMVEVISIEPEYVYVRIERFRDGMCSTLLREVRQIESVDERPIKGIIVDLRNNPGGTISEGILLSDLFLKQGMITSIKNRLQEDNELFTASPEQESLEYADLVILVNEKSASASELVAGALQYHKRATIVGENTYGKGSIQKVYTFDGNGAMKLTVGKYLLPEDKEVSKKDPVIPDIQVSSNAPDVKIELKKSVESLSISSSNKQEILDMLSQLPSPQKRQAIPWHLDFTERLTLDPQLATAWRTLTNNK